MTKKQMAAFSPIREILQEANVRWLVTDEARWPVEVAVPASRFETLALPEVAGFAVAPMDDAALHDALLERTLAHFRLGGAACEATGVRWVVTSALAMLLQGLPEWPESGLRAALVSDLAFHEQITSPPGVWKNILWTGGYGKVLFIDSAIPFLLSWDYAQAGDAILFESAVSRGGFPVERIESLLVNAVAQAAPTTVMDAFAARRHEIDWALADVVASHRKPYSSLDVRSELKAFRRRLSA